MTGSIYAAYRELAAHIDESRTAAGWEFDPDYGWGSPDGITASDWEDEGYPLPEEPGFAEFMVTYRPAAI